MPIKIGKIHWKNLQNKFFEFYSSSTHINFYSDFQILLNKLIILNVQVFTLAKAEHALDSGINFFKCEWHMRREMAKGTELEKDAELVEKSEIPVVLQNLEACKERDDMDSQLRWAYINKLKFDWRKTKQKSLLQLSNWCSGKSYT